MTGPNCTTCWLRLHDFNLRNLHSLVDVAADGIMFKDDWGSQTSLLISPRSGGRCSSRSTPSTARSSDDAGKFVFFHSDGYIADILPDLIEIGIDAINSQLFCMDIEELARKHKGQITFWGEIDRQGALVFGARTMCVRMFSVCDVRSTTARAASSPNANGPTTRRARISRLSTPRGLNRYAD